MESTIRLLILSGITLGIINIFAPLIIISEIKRLNNKLEDIENILENKNIEQTEKITDIKNKKILDKIINVFIEEEKE